MNKIKIVLIVLFTIGLGANFINAQEKSTQIEVPVRRPISPDQPMWLIHIDTWNYPDPQKIIDLIPEDIRPFVVMNISLSISHNTETNQFQVAEYGYEIAKSWVRTCAQNQMWATIQLSSGGYAQFSDFDLSVYEEFYQDYPNLIGFNYAEQFWGYDDPNDPLSANWTDRIAHFANLLELSHQYGGYLVVSWCGNQWSPSINPIAMMKRNADFAAACEKYTENFILCEKYTQQSYQSDMESLCLGAYLSGYSGNYGIRYDDTGWTNPNGENEDFTMATAGAVHLEHIMLTGETVIDGPELIWTHCFRETNRVSTTNGYSMRNWDTFPQFDNVSVDIFRKIIDGTIRIPTRKEVIDRTKVVIVNDVISGSDNDKYSSPETLFQELYRMDGDGNYENNKTFFKKTGRYPTIPTVYQLDDTLANSFQIQINKSDYANRWPSINDKVNELNNIFPSEYSGDLYAGRHENAWVTYNPYKTVQTASAIIPFKYNSCDSFGLSYSQYTAGVIKEYSDSLTIYLSNYDNEVDVRLKTDIIEIYGSSAKPTYSFTDRANHQASIVSESWSNGIYTLTIKHNGAVDITINCEGTATNRLTSFTASTIKIPEKPALYTGPRQYEAECFDYKNINNIVTAGQNGSVRNYTGQGYLLFGTSSSASVRDTVYALRPGTYMLKTRYSVTGGDVNNIDLYVNNTKVGTPTFTKTETNSDWDYNTQFVELNTGRNVIEFKANTSASRNIYFDNIVISEGNNSNVYHFNNDDISSEATTPPAQLITMQSGSAGVVSFTDAENITSNSFKSYSVGNTNETAVADLDMFLPSSVNYSVSWKEYYTTAGAEKGILLRGNNELCTYAEGMKQGYLFTVLNNEDSTVTLTQYIADSLDITSVKSYKSSFRVNPGQPCWYRAIALDNQLIFECSSDSLIWEGGSVTAFTDSTYSYGSTQLVWGFNKNNFDWVIDNIAYHSGILSVSETKFTNLVYTQGRGPSAVQSFDVVGKSLIEDIAIKVTNGFEISLSQDSGYDTTLTLIPVEGNVSTKIYTRLKSHLPVEKFDGTISITSKGTKTHIILVDGEVQPQPTLFEYNFSNDVASTIATTPPALKTSIGVGNNATAGVVTYTDANGMASNMLTSYSGGQRNATGVIDLNLFPKNATDYSVTWKQCLGESGTSNEVGMVLRGDTANIGNESIGYVQGMMHGYLFVVYNARGKTEFRISRSTSNNSVSGLSKTSVNIDPVVGQPVWYRASVSGSSEASLIFEYSTDSLNWILATSATESNPISFTSGATQFVWGLGTNDVNFYLDDIIYYGLAENSGTLPEAIEVTENYLEGFNYVQGFGPSSSKYFIVSADSLMHDIKIIAPFNFELSLDTLAGYSSSITLSQSHGKVDETKIYVRMKSELDENSYDGEVIISSAGVLSRIISLSGFVSPGPEIIINTTTISGFNFNKGDGPSQSKSFYLIGKLLQDDIIIIAPDYFEISLDTDSKYSSMLSIVHNNGEVGATRIYIRLKSGLEVDAYEGDILVTSPGVIAKTVSLSGVVNQTTAITDILNSAATVMSTQYYTLTGQRLNNIENMYGVFIVKELMSDGTVSTRKILVNK